MTVKNELDRTGIISLWKDAFGDEEEYINAFLDVVKIKGRFFGAYDDEKLLSMLFVVDMPIEFDCSFKKCTYMYACATREECRGKGLFGKLYKYAKSVLEKEEYDGIFCVPANEGLFEFYKKLGFDKLLYRQRIFAKNDKKPCDMTFEIKTGKEAYYVYESMMKHKVCCPLKSRSVFELSLAAAEAVLYTFDGGYLIYDRETVNELICKEDCGKILCQAARFFGKDICAYTFPADNNREKYAALCVLSNWDFPDNAYANMLMD